MVFRLTVVSLLYQFLQAVIVVEAAEEAEVGEVGVEEVGVGAVGVVVVVVEALVGPGAVRMSSSNLTDILVSSSPRVKTIYLSQRTLSLEKVFMARSGYLSKAASKTRRSNIAYGILSGVNWQRVYWVVWIGFSLNLEKRSYTSVLLVARVSVT